MRPFTRLYLVLILAAVFILMTASALAQGENLLVNGDFSRVKPIGASIRNQAARGS
jgi:hypothetical protein